MILLVSTIIGVATMLVGMAWAHARRHVHTNLNHCGGDNVNSNKGYSDYNSSVGTYGPASTYQHGSVNVGDSADGTVRDIIAPTEEDGFASDCDSISSSYEDSSSDYYDDRYDSELGWIRTIKPCHRGQGEGGQYSAVDELIDAFSVIRAHSQTLSSCLFRGKPNRQMVWRFNQDLDLLTGLAKGEIRKPSRTVDHIIEIQMWHFVWKNASGHFHIDYRCQNETTKQIKKVRYSEKKLSPVEQI